MAAETSEAEKTKEVISSELAELVAAIQDNTAAVRVLADELMRSRLASTAEDPLIIAIRAWADRAWPAPDAKFTSVELIECGDAELLHALKGMSAQALGIRLHRLCGRGVEKAGPTRATDGWEWRLSKPRL